MIGVVVIVIVVIVGIPFNECIHAFMNRSIDLQRTDGKLSGFHDFIKAALARNEAAVPSEVAIVKINHW